MGPEDCVHIAERMQHIEVSGIRRVFDLAASLEKPLDLSIGQPDFDVPEPVKEAAIRAIRSGRNGYTPSAGLPVLRERVAGWFTERGIQHEAVMVTPGASAALTTAILALAGPGDEVLIPDPFFVSYKYLAVLAGARPVFYNAYDKAGRFLPEAAEIAALVTPRTAAIVLNSPNNPTGAVYDERTVREIAAVAGRHGIAIISDECYDAFWYDTPPFSPGCIYRDTITINALSKLSAMTGWRLGFAAGPGNVINEMIKLQQFTFVCAPQPAQWAALVAFDVDFEPLRAAYAGKRDLLYNGIRRRFEVTPAAGAFYLFPRVPAAGMSAEQFCLKAIERRLLTVPGGVFSRCDTHLRLSFAAADEALAEGAETLCRLADELARGVRLE